MSSCTLTDQLLNDRYQIVEPLGKGGMGQTYIAQDTQRPNHPLCVVKQLKPASNDPEFMAVARRLFNSEAEILEKMGRAHDQIPQLLAYFEKGEEFYLVQDLVDGHPLSQEMPLGERWDKSEVIQMLQEVLAILKTVHGQGVIHRDIKPENLIRRKDGKLCLIDFGAVKQIRMHQTVYSQRVSLTVGVGTPGYMPTEQCKGKPRLSSDLYALGMVAIQALTGIFPSQLQEDDAGEVIWRDQAQVSQQLGNFIGKMVSCSFKQRFETAAEALQALQQLDVQPEAMPDDRQERSHQVYETQRTVKAGYFGTYQDDRRAEAPQPHARASTSGNSGGYDFTQRVAPQYRPSSQSMQTNSGAGHPPKWLIGIGIAVSGIFLIGSALHIQGKMAQSEFVRSIDQTYTANDFDACLAQIKATSAQSSSLYAISQSWEGKCQSAKAQQTTLQEIQRLKSNGRYAEAIEKAQSVTDTQSKFYPEFQKSLAENQFALAQQLADKGSFGEAINVLTKIDANSSMQAEVQKRKIDWSEQMYGYAEKLYQEGKNRADFRQALEMMQAIPQGSPAYNRSQKIAQEWQATEIPNWNDYEGAQKALEEGRWQDVRSAGQRLLKSSSQAWRASGQQLSDLATQGEKKQRTPIDEEGMLAKGEPNVTTHANNNTLFRDYEFQGKAGTVVTIGLQGEFDTKLYLISPDKQEFERNDDVGNGNNNSSITATLKQTGTYRVRVNAYYPVNYPGKAWSGKYRLTVHREGN
jgi:serine/threonine protein kinase, bacterial